MNNPIAQIEATAGRLAAESKDSPDAIEAGPVSWHDLDAMLSSVIGTRGVAAVYARCLDLNVAAHPWLATQRQTAHPFTSLETALAAQTRTEAEAANRALLLAFRKLLGHLIGDSLVDRLIGSAGRRASARLGCDGADG